MDNPEVAMICPIADRPQFLPQILASFRAQTYSNLWLLIYDNGREPIRAKLREREVLMRVGHRPNVSIGVLRNEVVALCRSEVIAHLDSDDVSHPHRVEEQIALLQLTGADVVGYRDLLLWDARGDGEAWLWRGSKSGHMPGTSFCYRRSAWEQRKFNPTSHGEDFYFASGLKVATASSFVGGEPRMIATIHGGNTMAGCYAKHIGKSGQYTRVREWDDHCRKTLDGCFATIAP